MADDNKEKRFLNYETSVTIYRTKTAMIYGSLYFSSGYQSTPVIGMQFADVNDPNAQEKTFAWDATERVWYFPTYDKVYELYRKLVKWQKVIKWLAEKKITDQEDIKSKTKEVSDKEKIANPIKKKTIYINAKFYNGSYYLNFMLSLGKDNFTAVSVTEDELEMMLQFIGDIVKNYHQLALLHRIMQISRWQGKDGGNGSGGKKSCTKKSSDSPPDDAFGGEPSKGSSASSNDVISGGAEIDDILKDLDLPSVGDDEIPF